MNSLKRFSLVLACGRMGGQRNMPCSLSHWKFVASACPCFRFWCFYSWQRIRANVDSTEQKRLLMDLDVSMRVTDCPYTVHFYGALFREVIVLTKGDVIMAVQSSSKRKDSKTGPYFALCSTVLIHEFLYSTYFLHWYVSIIICGIVLFIFPSYSIFMNKMWLN